MRSLLLLMPLVLMACGGPMMLLPGGELRGEVATTPVADWSAVDDPFVDLEVRPSDPYSVELNYFVVDGQLYVDPAEGRAWLDYMREDARVRARFGRTIYELEAVLVAEPGKHGDLEGFDPTRFIYRLDPRS